MKAFLFYLFFVVLAALSLPASSAGKGISLQELSDGHIRACLDYPDVIPDFWPLLIAQARESFQVEPLDSTYTSWSLPLPIGKAGAFFDPTLILMRQSHNDGLPRYKQKEVYANNCLFGRDAHGTVQLIGRMKPEDRAFQDDYQVKVDERMVRWFASDDKLALFVLLGYTQVHGGLDLYRIDLGSGAVAPSDHFELVGEEDVVDTRMDYTLDGKLYFRRKSPVFDPQNRVPKIAHYFVIENGRFIEVPESSLKIRKRLGFQAIADPYLLPRDLLIRLAPKPESAKDSRMILKPLGDPPAPPEKEESEGCELGRLGLKEFVFYLSSEGAWSGFTPSLAAQAAARPIKVMNRPAIKAEVVGAAAPEASNVPLVGGMRYTSCEQHLVLPQVAPGKFVYCSSGGVGVRLVGEVVKVSVPACPILKRLARAMTPARSEAFSIPIEGEVPGKDGTFFFEATADIQLVDGDWDERFTGPESAPGKK